jgi:Short C-terminal domain
MLGHHPLRAHELSKKGRRAFAKVIESERTHYAETLGNPAIVGDTDILWKLVLRVEPDGEPPFEVKVDELFPQLWSPSAGSMFPVLYDPADHSKVMVDRSEEATRLLEEFQHKQMVDAQVDRMRARGQGMWADRYQAVEDSLAQFRRDEDPSADPDDRARQWAEQKAKMKSIMAGDAEERVRQIRDLQRTDNLSSDPAQRAEQLAQRREQIKQLASGLGAPAPSGLGAPAASVGALDPAATADALTKLADLRDRGVLTEDEFQAQKKRLLG